MQEDNSSHTKLATAVAFNNENMQDTTAPSHPLFPIFFPIPLRFFDYEDYLRLQNTFSSDVHIAKKEYLKALSLNDKKLIDNYILINIQRMDCPNVILQMFAPMFDKAILHLKNQLEICLIYNKKLLEDISHTLDITKISIEQEDLIPAHWRCLYYKNEQIICESDFSIAILEASLSHLKSKAEPFISALKQAQDRHYNQTESTYLSAIEKEIIDLQIYLNKSNEYVKHTQMILNFNESDLDRIDRSCNYLPPPGREFTLNEIYYLDETIYNFQRSISPRVVDEIIYLKSLIGQADSLQRLIEMSHEDAISLESAILNMQTNNITQDGLTLLRSYNIDLNMHEQLSKEAYICPIREIYAIINWAGVIFAQHKDARFNPYLSAITHTCAAAIDMMTKGHHKHAIPLMYLSVALSQSINILLGRTISEVVITHPLREMNRMLISAFHNDQQWHTNIQNSYKKYEILVIKEQKFADVNFLIPIISSLDSYQNDFAYLAQAVSSINEVINQEITILEEYKNERYSEIYLGLRAPNGDVTDDIVERIIERSKTPFSTALKIALKSIPTQLQLSGSNLNVL